jgi:methylated-DNA-protein-cysteine methyltransferase related protein
LNSPLFAAGSFIRETIGFRISRAAERGSKGCDSEKVFDFHQPDDRMARSELYSRIYGAVKRIPRGKVATYGQIARLAGAPGHARLVGYALYLLREGSGVPWHRVINTKGRISLPPDPEAGGLQRALLESEGVAFGAAGSIDLRIHQWKRS